MNCSCLPLCEDLDYRLTVSHSTWPSSNQNADESQLKLQVYYDSMTKYTYTETQAYSMLVLVSDFGKLLAGFARGGIFDRSSLVGGQLGLWIGASFCTIVEILSLAISLLLACCCGQRHDIEKHRKEDESTEHGRNRPMAMKPPASTIYW